MKKFMSGVCYVLAIICVARGFLIVLSGREIDPQMFYGVALFALGALLLKENTF